MESELKHKNLELFVTFVKSCIPVAVYLLLQSHTEFLKMFQVFGVFTVFEKVKIPPQNGTE